MRVLVSLHPFLPLAPERITPVFKPLIMAWLSSHNRVIEFSGVRKISGKIADSQRDKQGLVMTYVVTESCIKCKYTDCVDVCPVDCFREGPNFLVIDPDECIDCTLCVAECPVEAIFAEDDVPTDQQHFITLNSELSKDWKPIIEKKDALADADDWAKVTDKLDKLER